VLTFLGMISLDNSSFGVNEKSKASPMKLFCLPLALIHPPRSKRIHLKFA
jgi:hypothetical protein